VSCRIWQTGLRNFEKFAAENCSPYFSASQCTWGNIQTGWWLHRWNEMGSLKSHTLL